MFFFFFFFFFFFGVGLQERRAFLFCQEDRAILCRECDIPIHRANDHTQKHSRFLLTGVKLSSYSSSSNQTSSSTCTTMGNDLRTQPSTTTTTKRSRAVCNKISSSSASASASASVEINPLPTTSDNASYTTSSISEYLMETLPGWHVEDFLDPSFPSNGFCKVCSTLFTLSTKNWQGLIIIFF